MRHRPLLTAVSVLLLGAAACTNTESAGSSPTARTTPSGASSPTAETSATAPPRPLTSLDPCGLIPERTAKRLDLHDPTPEPHLPGRSCVYLQQIENFTDGAGVTISIFDHAGVADPAALTPIGRHRGAITSSGDGVAVYSIEISATSRVDVTVTST